MRHHHTTADDSEDRAFVGWGIRKKRLPNGSYIMILPTKSERDHCMNRARQTFENMNVRGLPVGSFVRRRDCTGDKDIPPK